jgi:hypothetical protein
MSRSRSVKTDPPQLIPDWLSALLKEKKAVALFDAIDREPTVRPKDILTLLNFLYSCAWRYHMQSALPSYPQIATEIQGLNSDV